MIKIIRQYSQNPCEQKGADKYKQNIDYRYYVHGRVTHINNTILIVDAFNEDKNDKFGQGNNLTMAQPETVWLVCVDQDGEFIISMFIGAGISVITNAINNAVEGGDYFSISTTAAFRQLPFETAATYGGTSFYIFSSTRVMVLNQKYHYNYRLNNSVENIIRNAMTWYGKPPGNGTDFWIRFNFPVFNIK